MVDTDQLGGQAMQYTMTIYSKFIDMIDAVINNTGFKRKHAYIDETQRGLIALASHYNGGGKILSQEITPEIANVMSGLLAQAHIPHSTVEYTDKKTGKKKVSIQYRDIDKKAFMHVMDTYFKSLGIGVHETNINDFNKYCDTEPEIVIKGLTVAEADMFRHEAAKKDFVFAFSVEHGKYNLHYRQSDMDIVKDTLKGASYMLSGLDGVQNEKILSKSYRDRQQLTNTLDNRAKGSTLIIADSNNPGIFIAVNDNCVSLHNIIEVKKGIVDKAQKMYLADNEEILALAKNLSNPVVLTADQFNMCTIDGDGKAIPPDKDTFVKNRNELAVKIRDMPNLQLNPDVALDSKNIGQHVLINIPQDKMRDILNHPDIGRIPSLIQEGDKIVFANNDISCMDKILNETLYKDMDNLTKQQMRYAYEDRISDNVKSVDLLNGGNFVIVHSNFNSPKQYALHYSGDICTAYVNGHVSGSIDIHDPKYRDFAGKFLSAMSDPVVMTDAEFESPNALDRMTQIDPVISAFSRHADILGRFDTRPDKDKEAYINDTLKNDRTIQADERFEALYKPQTAGREKEKEHNKEKGREMPKNSRKDRIDFDDL